MIAMTPIEIINELKESEEDYDSAILATFNFDPIFFENQILPILVSKDLENIIVITDPIDYEESFGRAKKAGLHYFIEPVAATETFHPKFIILISKDYGKLIVGSANITLDGFTKNAEISTIVDYPNPNASSEALSVFLGLKDFLEQLVKKGYIKSEKHGKKILGAIDVPWLSSQTITTDKVKVIHNLNEPILDQLSRFIKGKPEKVILASYLYNPKVIQSISEKICKKIEVILQPGRVEGLSEDEVKNLIRDDGIKINFRKIIFKNEESRFLHAKIIVIHTDKGSYCLTGSANITSSALLSSASSGNIELCLLRYEEDKNYFNYLFDNEMLTTEAINLNEIKSAPYQGRYRKEKYDFDLFEARIERDNLVLEFSLVNLEYRLAKIVICNASTEKSIILSTNRNEEGEIVLPLDADARRFCQEPCYVSLELRKENDETKYLTSSKRWISSEIIELLPKKRDIERIRKTDGREGLIKLLNQLERISESPEMLLYYLQFIDFDSIYDTVNSLRRRVLRRIDEEIQEDQKIVLERSIISFNEVFSKVVKRHLKKFAHMIEYVESSPNLSSKVRKLFNLFLFINKLIIWFVLKKEGTHEFTYLLPELRYICGRNGTIENFCIKYLNQLREKIGPDEINIIVSELDVLTHVAILSKLIREIQGRDPEYERKNQGPLRVFDEVYKESIKNLCEGSDCQSEITSKVDKISQMLKEYEEFGNITLTTEEVVNNALKLLRNV